MQYQISYQPYPPLATKRTKFQSHGMSFNKMSTALFNVIQ